MLDLLTILQFDGRQLNLLDVIAVGVLRLDGQAGLGDHPVPQDHGGAAVLVAGPLAVTLRQRLKRRAEKVRDWGSGRSRSRNKTAWTSETGAEEPKQTETEVHGRFSLRHPVGSNRLPKIGNIMTIINNHGQLINTAQTTTERTSHSSPSRNLTLIQILFT